MENTNQAATAANDTASTETPSISPEVHRKFMETGEIDLAKLGAAPDQQDSDDSESASGEKLDVSGAPPEGAKSEDKPETHRSNRLDRRNKELNDKLAAAHARIEALEKATQGKAESQKTVTQRPKLKDFGTVEEWEEADTQYWESKLEATHKTAATIAQEHFESLKAKEQEAEQQKAIETGVKSFVDNATEFRRTLKEDNFAEVLEDVRDFLVEGKHSDLNIALYESKMGPALIHYLGEHFDELEKLAALPLRQQMIEFARLELSDKIKPATTQKHTNARRAIPDVNGTSRATNEDQELEDAALSGDQARFNRIMERREKRELAESRR